MPPFSTDDYYKLLQKIAVLETKIIRLEVNAEVNGLCGNETTLPLTQNSELEQANRKLISTNKTTKNQEGNKSTSSPPWNALGAKPKRKSCPWEMGGKLTGRTQHPQIYDATGWPALASEHSASSTPVQSKVQPWTTVKGRMSNKPPQQRSLQLENRFAPLLQDPGSRSDALDNVNSSHSRVRTKSNSEGKRLQGKLTTGPQTQTLIVGDAAVKDVKSMWSKDIKVLCFPKDMVSDLAERILDIVTAHPNVKNVVLHIGSNDVVKQQSEVLKRDFTGLLNTVSSVNAQVFISGPLPPIRRGVERFSRLLGLNTWLSTACKSHSVHFIDNFNFFWDRRHLFKADGLCLNKSGVKLFNSNLFYFLRHSSVPSAKDARQEESPLEEDTTQCARGPQGESFHPPPQASPGIQQRQEEASSSSLITLSPSSPLLEFTDHMKELVNAGTKLTPRPTPIFSPMIPPRGRPRTTLAPSPQTRHPPPPSPPQWNQPLSPQPDKDVPLQNVASTD